MHVCEYIDTFAALYRPAHIGPSRCLSRAKGKGMPGPLTLLLRDACMQRVFVLLFFFGASGRESYVRVKECVHKCARARAGLLKFVLFVYYNVELCECKYMRGKVCNEFRKF